jgi:hypothetical protein
VASELDGAVLVDFPLRAEWTAYNTPADRIPSHGTDMLGQRFAYDFIRVDRRKGWHVHPAGGLRSMDSPDIMTAHGVPAAFRRFEVERDGRWELAESVIPHRADRIRYPE